MARQIHGGSLGPAWEYFYTGNLHREFDAATAAYLRHRASALPSRPNSNGVIATSVCSYRSDVSKQGGGRAQGFPKIPILTLQFPGGVVLLESRQKPEDWSMLALVNLFPLETALYGLLAYGAAVAAATEKQAGHGRLSHHHGLAAIVYAFLSVAHIFHV